ncbi:MULTISPECIES: type VI secretion system contractile sheath small subunit [Pasteurellaceae]|uniref:Type VI secretion system contractile sheath small subunit n=2 Tax=Pasteurellaceae TaxID=712 RepID=A0ABU7QSF4_AVIPA|nr:MULTISPECIES: type VI secretion system contractile sheath small subunit [Pasteurellaceae]KGQ43095.1 type VI secretion protein [Gallibacterium anatis]KGQ53000.1 type VI secretion protein [Gallibacterium anatis]KGQ59125.1 type VI secretion protein [Gallibacterium anatis]MDK9431101.1 type VI secretion system contractile sheath small subunit [Gallibacterium anatis]UXN36565.1 type VI secretion system contractile sheath small subunit [Avibacterium paragallinarum]
MSKKEGSVAPKERINIKYVPATGGETAEVELPLNLLVVGDMKGKTEDTSIEDRSMVSIDKNNFSSVMEEMEIGLNINVPNKLDESAGTDDEINVQLDIKSLQDFSPDNIVKAVPELRKLLELREALTAVKGPLGNVPAFRTRIAELLEDEESRAQLLAELNIIDQK